MTCPKCRGDSPASASHCLYCGALLAQPSSPNDDPEVELVQELEQAYASLPQEKVGGMFNMLGATYLGRKESARVAFWKDAYLPASPRARMVALELTLSRARTLSSTLAEMSFLEQYMSFFQGMYTGGSPDASILGALTARMRTLLDLVRLDAAREDGSVTLRQVDTYEALVRSVESTLATNKRARARNLGVAVLLAVTAIVAVNVFLYRQIMSQADATSALVYLEGVYRKGDVTMTIAGEDIAITQDGTTDTLYVSEVTPAVDVYRIKGSCSGSIRPTTVGVQFVVTGYDDLCTVVTGDWRR